jgi:hypothetical protein
MHYRLNVAAEPFEYEGFGDGFELDEWNSEVSGAPRAPAPLPKDKMVFGSVTRELFVPFRKDFNAFRQEVRKAVGRYVTFRSDQGVILDKLINSAPSFLPAIQASHNFGLTTPPKTEFSPISIFATFIYTPGFKSVTRINFGS